MEDMITKYIERFAISLFRSFAFAYKLNLSSFFKF